MAVVHVRIFNISTIFSSLPYDPYDCLEQYQEFPRPWKVGHFQWPQGSHYTRYKNMAGALVGSTGSKGPSSCLLA